MRPLGESCAYFILFLQMVAEQVNLIHGRHPYGKIEKSTKSLHPSVQHQQKKRANIWREKKYKFFSGQYNRKVARRKQIDTRKNAGKKKIFYMTSQRYRFVRIHYTVYSCYTLITLAPVCANMIQTLVHTCRGLGCSLFL